MTRLRGSGGEGSGRAGPGVDLRHSLQHAASGSRPQGTDLRAVLRSNSLRSGPYLSLKHCVDKYPEAAKIYLGKSVSQLKWGTKIEKPGVMSLIRPEDVIIKLDEIMNS